MADKMILAQVFRDGMIVGIVEGDKALRVYNAAAREPVEHTDDAKTVGSAREAQTSKGVYVKLTPKQLAALAPLFDRVDGQP